MKLTLSFALSLLPLLAAAAKFKVKQVRRQQHTDVHGLVARQTPSDSQVSVNNQPNAVNLTSALDLIYLADITIAGVDYTVQLDTGSSDLWIKPPSSPLAGLNYTSHNVNLTYSIGWANGTIAFAPVEFLGLPVASQALLEVNRAKNAVLSSQVGGQGIAGLGFTGRSDLDAVLNKTGESTGRSLLYNLFMVHPEEPNFIAFALQRDSNNGTDIEGSFSIGEYDPDFVRIAGSNRIPTFPVHHPVRWNVLLDSVIINSPTGNNTIIVPESRLPYTPSNKAVVLLDSGASHTWCPPEIATALYGNIPGAYYNTSLEYWVVPCNAEIDMALQIGGQVFPLHPLDVVPAAALDSSVCVGSFIPAGPSQEFDWLIGDNFLRNVYSVYDFGDFDENGKMGDPYIKLLALVQPDVAAAEFASTRNTTARTTNITYVGLNGAEIDPVFFVTKDISDSLELIGKLVPAMLGLVALNALVITVCAIFWLVSFVRKRRNRRSPREPRGRSTPMPMQLTPRNSYIPGTPPPMPHIYEPVSMALTEDTFVPPSPAFRSKIQAGDRPKSVA